MKKQQNEKKGMNELNYIYLDWYTGVSVQVYIVLSLKQFFVRKIAGEPARETSRWIKIKYVCIII